MGRSTRQLGIGLGLLALFVAATVVAMVADTGGWEIDTVRWAHDLGDGWVWVLWPIMQLGSAPGAIVVAVVVGLTIGRRAGLVVFASYAVASVAANLTKLIVERPRPTGDDLGIDPRYVLDTFAFPSGHAAQAFAAVVAVALVATGWGRWRFVLIPIAGVTAFARMYYGVHYPGDVLAGAVLGTGVALVVDALVPTSTPATEQPSSRLEVE